MRTTLDIDDDLMAAAKELARRERTSAGKVVSDLMRRGLEAPATHVVADDSSTYCGFQPFSGPGKVVSNDDIDRLREEFGD